MGDRFYMQQAEGKRKIIGTDGKLKRKLKADWVKDIQDRLDVENLEGLLKTDLNTLKNLYEALDAENI